MVEVGKKVRATRFDGSIIEGTVKRAAALVEGGSEVTSMLGALVLFPKKTVGTRYYIKCDTCGGETPVDVYSTLEIVDE